MHKGLQGLILVEYPTWLPYSQMLKNLLLSPEPIDRFSRNLVCGMGLQPIVVGLNDIPRMTLTKLTARSVSET